MKPWIFQEIKEQRNIDLNSTERLELIQRYANYGLDHWGSGIEKLLILVHVQNTRLYRDRESRRAL
jgi:hypothetical protein